MARYRETPLSFRLLVSSCSLALDAALTSSSADDQCRLYRQYLQNGTGLYRHILFPGDVAEDPGYWATGNAWAVWGMLRVMVTMMHSQTYSDQLESQKADLKSWIVETLQASYASIDVSLLVALGTQWTDKQISAIYGSTAKLPDREYLRGRGFHCIDGIRILPNGPAGP